MIDRIADEVVVIAHRLSIALQQRPRCQLGRTERIAAIAGALARSPYPWRVPQSRLVAPLFHRWAGLRNHGRRRQQAQARARIDLADVNFGWWALASAFAFLPCAVVARATDVVMEQVTGWSSPSALGVFLLLGPWTLAAWFMVRAVITWGSGRVGLVDDIGVLSVLVLTGAYAVVVT